MNYKSSLTNILPIHPQSSESTPFSSPQRHSGPPARIRWQLLSAMGSASAPEHPGRQIQLLSCYRTSKILLHIHCIDFIVYLLYVHINSNGHLTLLSSDNIIVNHLFGGVASLEPRKILPGRRLSLPQLCVHCRLRSYPKIIPVLILLPVGQSMPTLFILLLLITLKQGIHRKCLYSVIPDPNCAVLYHLIPAIPPFFSIPELQFPYPTSFRQQQPRHISCYCHSQASPNLSSNKYSHHSSKRRTSRL